MIKGEGAKSSMSSEPRKRWRDRLTPLRCVRGSDLDTSPRASKELSLAGAAVLRRFPLVA